METDTKPIWTSKTMWTNIIGVSYQALSHQFPNMPALDDINMLLVLGIVNLILRFITKKPVTLS